MQVTGAEQIVDASDGSRAGSLGGWLVGWLASVECHWPCRHAEAHRRVQNRFVGGLMSSVWTC